MKAGTLELIRLALNLDETVVPEERSKLIRMLSVHSPAAAYTGAPTGAEPDAGAMSPSKPDPDKGKADKEVSAWLRIIAERVQSIGQKQAELARRFDDDTPFAVDTQRKAAMALIRKAEFGCTPVENKAALLAMEGRALSAIAKSLPHKHGQPMSREGVRKVLRRFEEKSGMRGLFSRGSYRQNVRIATDRYQPECDPENPTES